MGWRALVEELGVATDRFAAVPDFGDEEAIALVRDLARDLKQVPWSAIDPIAVHPPVQPILAASPALRAEVVGIAVLLGAVLHDRLGLQQVAEHLAAGDLPLDDLALVAVLASNVWGPPAIGMVAARRDRPVSEALVSALRARADRLLRNIGWESPPEGRKAWLTAARLSTPDGCPLAPCPWGDRVAAEIRARPNAAEWIELLWHAAQIVGRTRPTRQWTTEGARRVAAVGASELRDRIVAWCDCNPGREGTEWDPVRDHDGVRPTNLEVFRGLLFLTAPIADQRCVDAITEVALRAWKKGGFGPRAAHFGVGAIAALASTPLGQPGLDRIRAATSYERARRELDRAR